MNQSGQHDSRYKSSSLQPFHSLAGMSRGPSDRALAQRMEVDEYHHWGSAFL